VATARTSRGNDGRRAAFCAVGSPPWSVRSLIDRQEYRPRCGRPQSSRWARPLEWARTESTAATRNCPADLGAAVKVSSSYVPVRCLHGVSRLHPLIASSQASACQVPASRLNEASGECGPPPTRSTVQENPGSAGEKIPDGHVTCGSCMAMTFGHRRDFSHMRPPADRGRSPPLA
jgi:hypothetical protein